jgi:hypothetical protein
MLKIKYRYGTGRRIPVPNCKYLIKQVVKFKKGYLKTVKSTVKNCCRYPCYVKILFTYFY